MSRERVEEYLGALVAPDGIGLDVCVEKGEGEDADVYWLRLQRETPRRLRAARLGVTHREIALIGFSPATLAHQHVEKLAWAVRCVERLIDGAPMSPVVTLERETACWGQR